MLNHQEILDWLCEQRPDALERLWALADTLRRENVGDEVHLRGLIEISNICSRRCGYCGIAATNAGLVRYRMTAGEILECVKSAVKFGYGTVVLQAGEDPGLTTDFIEELIVKIRAQTPLAVTLSLGERSDEELVRWRKAGADRYLLRFETSNPELFERIHPSLPGARSDRIAILRRLRELDYEVGSGVMIGIPGQSYDDLARDIETFAGLDLDMIGVGPFIPHPQTPLGAELLAANAAAHPHAFAAGPADARDQAPNTEGMTYKVVALARLVCPMANIPSTTALATLNKETGRELGLMRGANIVMPNLTPPKYRSLYEIYPAKACIFETSDQCQDCIKTRIKAIGRTIGKGPGPSPNQSRRK